MRQLFLAIVFGCLAACVSGVAHAQDTPESSASTEPTILPHFDEGFATDDEVREAVGSVSLSFDNCKPVKDYMRVEDDRVVRAVLARMPADIEEKHRVLDTVLADAAKYAWRNCPIPYLTMMGDLSGDYHYNVWRVLIVGPDGQGVLSASLGGHGLDGTGDQALAHGHDGYVWKEVTDLLAISREQAAQAAAAQAAANAMAIRQTEGAEQARKAKATIKGWFQFIFFAVIALVVFLTRESILGWFYSLTPHPATGLVGRRLDGGGPIDGALFAEIMRPIPGNHIEQRVRAEQARELAARARRAAEARLAELNRVKAEALRDAAYLRAQTELHSAVEAHELAMARLAAARAWRKRNVG